MRGGESRDLGSQASTSASAGAIAPLASTAALAPAAPAADAALAARRPRSHNDNLVAVAAAGMKESVARQLDFDADGTPLRQSLRVLKHSAGPSSSPARHRYQTMTHGTPASRCPLGSPPYACTSGSDWDPVDWDSSLSREVVSASSRTVVTSVFRSSSASIPGASPATTLHEFSPLRSDCGLTVASMDSPVNQALAPGAGCPHCSNRQSSMSMPIEASALSDGRQLPVAIERVRSSSEGRSILLQLRLGEDWQQRAGLACLSVDSVAGACPDSGGLVPRARSQSHQSSPLVTEKPPLPSSSPSPLEMSQLPSSCLSFSALSEAPTNSHSVPAAFAGLVRCESAPHLAGAGHQQSRTSLCESCGQVASQKVRSRKKERKESGKGSVLDALQLQALRSKYLGSWNVSLDELHCTVDALRQRYLQHYFQAKPLRHPSSLGRGCHPARAASDSQLLHCRRARLGLRGKRASAGSRVRGRQPA